MLENIQVFLVMAFVIIFLTLAQGWIPYLTRKTLCFGISIPENQFNNPEFVEYRKMYRNQNIILGIISIAALFLGTFLEKYFVFVYIAIIFVNITISFIIFYGFHKKVREYKNKSDWKEKTTFIVGATMTSENRTFINKAWFLVYPVIIIITAAFGLYYFNSLPFKIAMQYDFSGNVTRYAEKSIWIMLFTPMIQIFISGVFMLTFFIIKNSRRQIDLENKEESERKLDVFRKTWGYFTVFGGAVLLLMMFVMQLSMFNVLPIEAALIIFFILLATILISVTIISFKVGQGGSRLSTKARQGEKISVKDDDKYWKLGSFYVNKEDPALFVEKRFGIGWTLNFGRPMAFVIMGALVVFIILMLLLSSKV